jgi:hypothetical protein
MSNVRQPMATLVWHAPMRYRSAGDERAFFGWLQSIPGVVSVRGEGRELHIGLRSNRVSSAALRELLALYARYGGKLEELARFENASNTAWFSEPGSYWHTSVFAPGSPVEQRSTSK